MTNSDVQPLLQSLQRLFAARRAIVRHLDSRLQAGGVPVLGVLARCGEQRLGDLAAALHVHPSVITRQIADLEQRGCVDRRFDPQDRRSSFVTLTDGGIGELRRYYTEVGRFLDEVLAEWDDDDVRTLSGLVQRLTTDVEARALAAA